MTELVLLLSVWSEAAQHFMHFPSANCQIQLLHPHLTVLADTLHCPFCPGICYWSGPNGPEFLCIPALVAECSQEMALPVAHLLPGK